LEIQDSGRRIGHRTVVPKITLLVKRHLGFWFLTLSQSPMKLGYYHQIWRTHRILPHNAAAKITLSKKIQDGGNLDKIWHADTD